MARSTFVYVIYIRATPEKVWAALTDGEFMKQYWFGMRGESRWVAGSPWQLVSEGGEVYDAGEIVESDPPRRLVIRWHHRNHPELKAEGPSLCTMEVERCGTAVKLSVTHTIEREPSRLIEAVSGGWPKVLSNLKSLVEMGSVALLEPYPAAAGADAERKKATCGWPCASGRCPRCCAQRCSTGTTLRGVEPTKSWRGRPILYSGSAIISLSCAIQPTVRASANTAVNRLTGMPMALCTMPE